MALSERTQDELDRASSPRDIEDAISGAEDRGEISGSRSTDSRTTDARQGDPTGSNGGTSNGNGGDSRTAPRTFEPNISNLSPAEIELAVRTGNISQTQADRELQDRGVITSRNPQDFINTVKRKTKTFDQAVREGLAAGISNIRQHLVTAGAVWNGAVRTPGKLASPLPPVGGGGVDGNQQVGDPLTPAQIIASLRNGVISYGQALTQLNRIFMQQGIQGPTASMLAARRFLEQAGFRAPEAGGAGPGDVSFGEGPPTLLEEIFRDRGRGKRALVTEFLGEQFPGQTGGTFRNIIEGFRDPINQAFDVSRALGGVGAGTLEDFLGSLGGAFPRISGPQFGELGRLISAGAESIPTESQFDIQRTTLEELTSPGGQRRQFELGVGQRQRDLPFDLRGAFGRLANRRFDEILAAQGRDPDFQILPFIQQQGLFR